MRGASKSSQGIPALFVTSTALYGGTALNAEAFETFDAESSRITKALECLKPKVSSQKGSWTVFTDAPEAQGKP
jgi:hypothetical protein